MKLATFEVETPFGPERRVGISSNGRLIDATTGYACVLDERGEPSPVELADAIAPPEMLAFLERGERAIEAAREVVAFVESAGRERGPNGARIVFDPAEIDLLSPLPRPNSLCDCMAFEEHVTNTMGEDVPDVWYEQPIYYKGNPDSVRGTGETVVWPDSSDLMDFELELAAVIGREGRDIPVAEADSYIAGYTIFNDFSARDVQGREMEGNLGPAKGKDFANALGPYLVTPGAIDIESATMIAEVDGETWSSGTPGEMEHTFPEIVAHVSRDETIHPGDVIGSGTVGEGCGLELGRFLDDGDRVALSVEGIGTLENQVIMSS
ncbi:fumarylacetoacetate hydrolase family protein [Halococcus sediminicola]|uniref:fumarylacetoacetate hydrolase family protein n=1 Tax=Halococcus sediminicola TaxID=1264579 RepID=UPI00067981AF|nr:fumarylacetoacetate hydrolase family protein [Halococcus sediminicola]